MLRRTSNLLIQSLGQNRILPPYTPPGDCREKSNKLADQLLTFSKINETLLCVCVLVCVLYLKGNCLLHLHRISPPTSTTFRYLHSDFCVIYRIILLFANFRSSAVIIFFCSFTFNCTCNLIKNLYPLPLFLQQRNYQKAPHAHRHMCVCM